MQIGLSKNTVDLTANLTHNLNPNPTSNPNPTLNSSCYTFRHRYQCTSDESRYFNIACKQ